MKADVWGIGILERIQELVWGPAMLSLFLGTGLLCMWRLRGFPVLGIRSWWRETAGKIGSSGTDAGNQVKTACTALAATVGTGNIAGVATALAAGGPGAVFWMWVSSFLGMATAYAEVYLGSLYRNRSRKKKKAGRKDGVQQEGAETEVAAGPFLYLEQGLGWRWGSILFAFFCVMTSLGMGSMVQASSIAESVRYVCSLPSAVTGGALVFLTALVILGGGKRISETAQLLVPFSAGCYLFFGGIVVLSCWHRIPGVLGEICSQALSLKSAAGGAAGYTMAQAVRFGVARGVFSNEAGLGSLAIFHGSSEGESRPEEQGMWAIFEVFFDTVICCTLTALILLCMGEQGGGSGAVARCFSRRFGSFGGWFTAASMMLFAFASVIAWFYPGRQAAAYLARFFPYRKPLLFLYTCLYLGAVFLGCTAQLSAVWLMSDIFNGLMAVPNLMGILFLLREVEKPLDGKNRTAERK